MLINKNDELLIQRCVDDELSPSETGALLQRLDQLDGGWKRLTCELLEDRSLRRIIGSRGVQSGAATSARGQEAPVSTLASNHRTVLPAAARSAIRHGWTHPVTSLTLCAAIAFVGGMLIPDLGLNGPNKGVVSNPARKSAIPRALNADTSSSAADSYRVQMQPGGPSVEIPVYSGIQDLVRSDRNHPLFSDSIQNADGQASQVQWMIVPVDDHKMMMIPVSEDTLDDMQ